MLLDASALTASLLVKPETTTDDLSLPGKATFLYRWHHLQAKEVSRSADIDQDYENHTLFLPEMKLSQENLLQRVYGSFLPGLLSCTPYDNFLIDCMENLFRWRI